MNLCTLRNLMGLLAVSLLVGCATPKTVDYSAYKQARPKSILVLPPLSQAVLV